MNTITTDRIYQIIDDINEFAQNFNAGCDQSHDIPMSIDRSEPPECLCRINGSEQREAMDLEYRLRAATTEIVRQLTHMQGEPPEYRPYRYDLDSERELLLELTAKEDR